jgi:probable H4MPT-linked C1 transfer pathway protein
MKILGLDIGGANLKHAAVNFVSNGTEVVVDCSETYFPFWTDHKRFDCEIAAIRKSIEQDSVDAVAVTITAELADCFESKRQGINFIVDEIEKVFSQTPCRYYSTRGILNEAAAAKSNWSDTAASNWHASAWYLFQKHRLGDGFMIDIGSTTTDIIAVKNGWPVSNGATDLDRLRSGQLLYAGVGRTPVCSLIDEIDLDGTRVSLARELFATMADAIAWHQAEPSDGATPTADGRSNSVQSCRSRLCRMLCADDGDLSDEQVDQIAEQCVFALRRLVTTQVHRVVGAHPDIAKTFVVAGSGKWLAKEVVELVGTDHLSDALADRADPVRVVEPFASGLASQVVPAMAVAAKYHCDHRTD